MVLDDAKDRRDEIFKHKFQDIVGYISASQVLILALEEEAKQFPELDNDIAPVIRQEQQRIKNYQRELKEIGV